MSEQQHYKGACTRCGGRIEFPAAAAGSAITCPHCGGSTQLLPPPSPPAGGAMAKCACRHCHGHIEFPIAAAGMAVACPHCGQQTVLATAVTAAASVAPPPPPPPPPPAVPPKQTATQAAMSAAWEEAEATGEMVGPNRTARKAGQSKLGKVLSVITVLLVGAAAAGLLYKKKHGQPVQAKRSGKDLEVLTFALQKAKEGELVYVVGTLTNHASVQYFNLRVEFDVFDKDAQKVESTTDIVNNLGPASAWNFKAIVLGTNAAEVKLVKAMGEADTSAKSKKDE